MITGPGGTTADEDVMRLALAEANLAPVHADIPVGAVVVDRIGTIIGRSHNRREVDADPTAHAEILALRQAAAARGSWRLTDCTLVVTLEPCTMCAGAIVLSRIDRLVFGSWNDEMGAVGTLWDVVRDRRLNHRAQVTTGVLADECSALLRQFFTAHRDSD